MTFGEKLVRLRREKGLSQEALAGELGVSRQAVSRWEMGAAMLDSPNLLKLSRMFQVSADYLLYDEYEEEHHVTVETAPVKESHGLILTGGIVLGASLLVLLPAVSRALGHEYSSFKTFLMVNDLKWLFVLLVITALAGAVALCIPWLKKRWTVRKKKGEQ